jgi:transcriptional regulator with XRE-family HTH domain
MPANVSPEVRRRRLAAELRRLRDRSGMTGDEVAKRLGWSPSKVSRYELARTGLKPTEVRRLLDVYGVEAGRRDQLLALANEAKEKGWWEDYPDVLAEAHISLIGLEDEATTKLSWHVEVIPGLLQEESYARQINTKGYSLSPVPPSQIERSIRMRLRRQQLLTRDPPLNLVAVMDESVLLRKLADAPVMRAQLHHLIDVAQLPNVSVRILPLGQDWPITIGSFEILKFAGLEGAEGASLQDVVYTEHLLSTLNFEGEVDALQYQLVFDRLLDRSLDEGQSMGLIAATAARVWT